jgi:prepilin-type N-terminal cleavage/methylation domain-containing protein
MKKHGYTLAELLISITIIGVLTAIILPLVNKYKPDANKAIYLTTYDSIVTAVQNMINNDKIYPMPSNNDADSYLNYPLTNQVAVTIDGTAISANSAKFCNVLALSFNTLGTISCSSTYDALPTFEKSFQTTNGVVFQVFTNQTTTVYQSDIYIDVNGENKGKNCFYSDNCKNPDRFKFLVAASGKVYPADKKGQSYVATRTNMKQTADTANNYTNLVTLPNNEKYLPAYWEKHGPSSATFNSGTVSAESTYQAPTTYSSGTLSKN